MKEDYKKFLLNHPDLKGIGEKGIEEILKNEEGDS